MSRKEMILKYVNEYNVHGLHSKLPCEKCFNTLVEIFIEDYSKPIFPHKDETTVAALSLPKTSALCFDRVWSLEYDMPDSIRFFTDTPHEIRLTFLNAMQNVIYNKQNDPESDLTMCQVVEIAINMIKLNKSIDAEGMKQFSKSFDMELMSRSVCRAIEEKHGFHVLPLYSNEISLNTEYKPGTESSIVTLINELEVVDEEETSWEQVLEFRADNEARRKYRRFIHWLNSELLNRPIQAIIDEINIRLEDYQWAIRKHGFSMITGTLSSILNTKTLFGAASAYGACSFALHDLLAIFAGGAVLVGKASVHMAEELLKLENIKRTTNPEVAFVRYARSNLKKQGQTLINE